MLDSQPSWEHSKAKIWSGVIWKQKVIAVEPTTWPRVCNECGGEDSEACWRCGGTGEDAPEPAVKIIFANGAELVVRSQYAAALFVRQG